MEQVRGTHKLEGTDGWVSQDREHTSKQARSTHNSQTVGSEDMEKE